MADCRSSDVASVHTDARLRLHAAVCVYRIGRVFQYGQQWKMQRKKAAGAGAEPEGGSRCRQCPCYMALYVYDGAVSWSEDPEENF